MFISISLLVLTFLMAIIPFTGEVALNRSKGKLHYKGWVILLTGIVMLCLGSMQIVSESSEQDKRDSTQANTLNNTVRILGDVGISANKTLSRFDSISKQLDSLEVRTSKSIERRNEILGNFDKLNGRLEKIYAQKIES